MFVIKYDKLSMIELVQCIEKHPSIYNTKKHFSKEELDLAWDKVAIEVGEKDSLCRDRWHSIKSCYIRHLKYSALNSKRRPYYLAEFLDFLQPFVQDRIKNFLSLKQFQLDSLPCYLKEALPQSQPLSSYFVQGIGNVQEPAVKEEEDEVVDVEEISETEWLSICNDSQPSSSKTVAKRPKPNMNLKPSKKTKTVQPNDDSDEDARFLKGLLPEVFRMSCHQKLKFKQETLSIIEDILYASDDIMVTE